MIPKVKEPSVSLLIKELDDLVSIFVRLSAADENGTVMCVSCDARLYWKDADCAHFIGRSNMATRYYLPNLAPACKECNRHDPDLHIIAWEAKMGMERANQLRQIGRMLWKYTRVELLEEIDKYKVLVAQLKKQKA